LYLSIVYKHNRYHYQALWSLMLGIIFLCGAIRVFCFKISAPDIMSHGAIFIVLYFGLIAYKDLRLDLS